MRRHVFLGSVTQEVNMKKASTNNVPGKEV